MTPIYPPDRLRGPDPAAPVWAVARGFAPRSHYVVTGIWADQPERYAAAEIALRGLTYEAALEWAQWLNNPHRCTCEWCLAKERARVQSGGTG